MIKKVPQHVVIMDMFREVKENKTDNTLTIEEIVVLTGFKRDSVAGRITELCRTHEFEAIKIDKVKAYRLVKENTTAKLPYTSPPRNRQTTVPIIEQTPPVLAKMKTTTNTRVNELIERCFYLTQAHRSLTQDMVGDAFNITNEEAGVLMNKVARKYKIIKSSITLHC